MKLVPPSSDFFFKLGREPPGRALVHKARARARARATARTRVSAYPNPSPKPKPSPNPNPKQGFQDAYAHLSGPVAEWLKSRGISAEGGEG